MDVAGLAAQDGAPPHGDDAAGAARPPRPPLNLTTVAVHVFVPERQLPCEWTPADEGAEQGLAFAAAFSDFLQDSGLGQQPVATALRSFRDARPIHDRLAALASHAPPPVWIYLRRQSCLLRLVATGGIVRIAAFDLHVSRAGCGEVAQVLPVAGDPMPLKARLAMPRQEIRADKAQVLSEPFADQVTALLTTDLPSARPVITKKGDEHAESRELPLPVVVFDWLLPTLDLGPSVPDVRPAACVLKAVRTESRFSKGMPWRRSLQWTAVRALVHTTLLEAYGAPATTTACYKAHMLRFHTWLAEQLRAHVPAELGRPVLVKLASRVTKLDAWLKSEPARNVPPEVVDDVQQSVAAAEQAARALRAALDRRWNETVESAISRSAPDTDATLAVEDDDIVRHQLPDRVQSALCSTLAEAHATNADAYPPSSPPCRASSCLGSASADLLARVAELQAKLDKVGSADGATPPGAVPGLDLCLALLAVETSACTHLWRSWRSCIKPKSAIAALAPLVRGYIERARKAYTGDSLRSSGMVLTLYSLSAIIDGLALRADSLGVLRSHAPPVRLEPLQQLLLASRADLQHLAEVEAYWSTRLATGTPRATLVLGANGLPYRYAIASPALQQAKVDIEAETKKATEAKLAEADTLIAKFEQLDRAVSASYRCECTVGQRGNKELCSGCRTKAQNTAARDSLCISKYERPLPDNPVDAQCALFFWKGPAFIAHWLNHCTFLAWQCLQGYTFKTTSVASWWPTEAFHGDVRLGSTVKALDETHYARVAISEIRFNKYQVICPQARTLGVVIPQIGKTVYAHSALLATKWSVRGATFMVPLTKPYQSVPALKALFGEPLPTQNVVLAAQSDCPKEIKSLAEFIAIGSLRAGAHLQLRNVVLAVEERLVVFEDADVHGILAQALLQTGPRAAATASVDIRPEMREWKLDLDDDVWAGFACDELGRLLDSVDHNWDRHGVLHCVLLVATYFANLARPTVRPAYHALLRRCRAVALRWMDEISEAARTAEAAAGATDADPNQARTLRQLQATAAAYVVLSYDADSEGAATAQHHSSHPLLRSSAVTAEVPPEAHDATALLHALVTIANHTALDVAVPTASNVTRLGRLLAHARRVACEQQSRLCDLIRRDPAILSAVVRSKWDVVASSPQAAFALWEQHAAPADRWFYSRFGPLGARGEFRTVQLDVVSGLLLVGGAPISRLPLEISSHTAYRQVFGGDVMTVMPGELPGAFRSEGLSDGLSFEFGRPTGAQGMPRICQVVDVATRLVLLPKDLFTGFLPVHFVRDFSHWYDVGRNRVLLRPPTHGDSRAFAASATEPTWTIQLDGPACKSATITERVTGHLLCSAAFVRQLAGVLHRLDDPEKHAHVMRRAALGPVLVAFPRHDLKFEVVPSPPGSGLPWRLASLDYTGFVVDQGHALGTLVGWESALVLAHASAPALYRRKVLVPHVHRIGREGDTYTADFEGLAASPSYFVYEVNDDLRLLSVPSGSRAALLFLAYLHAATSSDWPDPFTGLTGLEAAVGLVRRCWSNAPYDAACRALLHRLAALAPKRRRYPKFSFARLEIIEHASLLRPGLTTPTDPLKLLVHLLLADSARLAVLHASAAANDSGDDGDKEGISLSMLTKDAVATATWAYWRALAQLPPTLRLTSAEEEQLAQPATEWVRSGLRDPSVPVLADAVQPLGAIARYLHAAHGHPAGIEGLAAAATRNSIPQPLSLLAHLSKAATSVDGVKREVVQAWRSPSSEPVSVKPTVGAVILSLYAAATECDSPASYERLVWQVTFTRYCTRAVDDPWQQASALVLEVAANNLARQGAGPTAWPQPPEFETIANPSELWTSEHALKSVVAKHTTSYASSPHERETYDRVIAEQTASVMQSVRSCFEEDPQQPSRLRPRRDQRWPQHLRYTSFGDHVNSTAATEAVRQVHARLVLFWELHDFAAAVDDAVRQVLSRTGLFSTPADVAPVCTPTAAALAEHETASPWLLVPGVAPSARPNARHATIVAADPELDAAANVLWTTNEDPHVEALFQRAVRRPRGSAGGAATLPSFPFDIDALNVEESVRESSMFTDADGLVKGLKQSWRLYQRSAAVGLPVLASDTADSATTAFARVAVQCYVEALARAQRHWNVVIGVLAPAVGDAAESLRELAGLRLPVVPVHVLPLLLQCDDSTKRLRQHVAAFGVYRVYAARARRCQRSELPEPLRLRELDNARVADASPSRHPAWLLFELEQDLSIRAVQVQVALEMLRAPATPPAAGDHANRCVQLNMGEGKTSVIIPMLCAAVASQGLVPQVTVLTSLFETNYDQLFRSLSGLLGLRVVQFPFRRAVSVTPSLVEAVLGQLRALAGRACVVAVPEHRLSLRLKQEELHVNFRDVQALQRERVDAKPGDGKVDIGATLQQLHTLGTWTAENVWNLLDESDELLRHKYQLVYPVGSQLAVDGGERRWLVQQAVLACLLRTLRIPGRLSQLCPDPSTFVLYEDINVTPAAWPRRFRINPGGIVRPLLEAVVDSVLEGTEMVLGYLTTVPRNLRPHLRRYILDPAEGNGLTRDTVDTLLSSPSLRDRKSDVLILRGLFAYGILQHMLRLRWSVDYGVAVMPEDADGVRPAPRTPMAVPFRARGVASERTEFGHPDVAILATHLSYYATGLGEEQMQAAVEGLLDDPNGPAVYAEWVALSRHHVAAALQSFNNINLSNAVQQRELFRTFRLCTATVNYWLGTAVFPRETKQFPHKLVASAWDLAEAGHQPVRGFSGTNDSSMLLPLSIIQRDLPQLQGTNGEILAHLTRPENREYHAFNTSAAAGEAILTALIRDVRSPATGRPCRVLIDAGAVMDDMENIDVARAWLRLLPDDHDIEAAVCFDNNRLVCVTRAGAVTPFDLSPYASRLGACIVFLDDAHTRGTDLKFPVPTHAVVTLCSGVCGTWAMEGDRGRDVDVSLQNLMLTALHRLALSPCPAPTTHRQMRKDKLVQACMRMRQLGRGHSICFWAPTEVDRNIRALLGADATVGPAQVLLWSTLNTVKSTQEAMVAWATQGFMHSRKAVGHHVRKTLSSSGAGEDTTVPADALNSYARFCELADVLELDKLYRQLREAAPLEIAIESAKMYWLRKIGQLVHGQNDVTAADRATLRVFRDPASHIEKRCNDVAAQRMVQSHALDEEHERELEEELEEERQMERPGKATPHVPESVHPALVTLVATAAADSSAVAAFAQPLVAAYRGTRIEANIDAGAWDARLWASTEYSRVIKETHHEPDSYVRPPAHALVVWGRDDAPAAVILLSDYEANALLPHVRARVSAADVSLHHIVCRLRPGQTEFMVEPGSCPGNALAGDGARRTKHLAPLCTQLAVFASSLYHRPRDGEAIVRFLGLVPAIDPDGTVPSPHRRDLERFGLIDEGDGFLKMTHDQRPVAMARSASSQEAASAMAARAYYVERVMATRFRQSPAGFLAQNAVLRRLESRVRRSQLGQWLPTYV